MKVNKYIGMTMMAAGLLAAASCTDFSDYNEAITDAQPSGNQTLWENIRQNQQLSEFAALVQKAGFDKELSQTQYYTVWAPLNGSFDLAALQQLDNKALLQQFVYNHVAAYGHNASGALNERVHMLNGKSYDFTGAGTYTFDGVNVSRPNQPSNNGIMHIMDGAAVYHPNLYDFLTNNQLSAGKGVDSLCSYFQRYEYSYLDENASVVGPIVDGVQTYIDSVMVKVNTLTASLNARLEQEDSSYTFLMPTNEVWNKSYDRIKGYFNYIPTTKAQAFVESGASVSITETSYDVADPAYLCDSLTKLSIVGDLIFSNNDGYNKWVESTPTYLGSDTLRATTWDKLSNPNDILNPDFLREKVRMSNGYGRIVDSLAIYPWESYAPEFSFSTRNNLARVATGNTHNMNVVLRGFEKYEFAKDGSLRYVWAEPNGGYSKPEMDIYLPNVQSTTYDLYCVFVPERFDNPGKENYLPNRVIFELNYCDEKGNLQNYTFLNETEENIAAFNEYIEQVRATDPAATQAVTDNATNRTTFRGYSNNPLKVDTVYIGQFTFPVSYYGLGSNNAKICPNIKITSPMSVFNKTLMAAFGRDLRVAAILAKPLEYVEFEESNKK